MYAIPPGPAFHPVPPGIASSFVQPGPVLVPPVMPPPSIHGVTRVERQHQHPGYAVQQALHLDPGPSQPHRRSLDEHPVPYHPLQAKTHSSTSGRHGGHERRHTRVVPVYDASLIATDGSYSGRTQRTSHRHSYPAHDARPRSHEHQRHDTAHHQLHTRQPAHQQPSTRRDDRESHGHIGHRHASTHHPDHHSEEPPSNAKLSRSYKPTPPPSTVSERGRSSVDIEEPRPRELSVPRHRTLDPRRSAMKSDHRWGIRRRRGPVRFLLNHEVDQGTDDGRPRTRGYRLGWSRSRWPGTKGKNKA